MNIEAHRKNIIHRILDIQNETILNKIEALLNEEGYIYSISGEFLSEEEYKNQIATILLDSEDSEGYTSDEIKKSCLKNETRNLVRKVSW